MAGKLINRVGVSTKGLAGTGAGHCHPPRLLYTLFHHETAVIKQSKYKNSTYTHNETILGDVRFSSLWRPFMAGRQSQVQVYDEMLFLCFWPVYFCWRLDYLYF